MTKIQEKLVNQIKESALPQLGLGVKYMNDHEIKEWEVEECKYFVSVLVEVGLKGDEGTLASIFGRSRCHIFITPRGKMTYPISRKLKNGEWKHYYRNLNGKIDLFKVSVDQDRK